MSNAAALRIVAVSTDVLFTTMDDVFVTGICRAVTGIGCSFVTGIADSNQLTSTCDVASGRTFSVHYVTLVQMTSWWNFVSNGTSTDQACDSHMSTLHLVITCAALLSVICCLSVCRRKRFSVLLCK